MCETQRHVTEDSKHQSKKKKQISSLHIIIIL